MRRRGPTRWGPTRWAKAESGRLAPHFGQKTGEYAAAQHTHYLGSTPRLCTCVRSICGASSPLPPWRLCQWGWGVVLGPKQRNTKPQQTAPWTYPPGGVRRGEEGVQQHLQLLSQIDWLRTLGRKLGGVLPGSAHALAWEYSPAMHVGAEHVRGTSSPLPPLREQLCQ